MTPEEYEKLPDQSKELVCTDHGVPMVKAASGKFVCLFCEREEWEAAGGALG